MASWQRKKEHQFSHEEKGPDSASSLHLLPKKRVLRLSTLYPRHLLACEIQPIAA
jgi:hypothetical protein